MILNSIEWPSERSPGDLLARSEKLLKGQPIGHSNVGTIGRTESLGTEDSHSESDEADKSDSSSASVSGNSRFQRPPSNQAEPEMSPKAAMFGN